MSEPPILLRLFVYGTLKPGGCYYRVYCAGRTTSEVPAQVRGQLCHLSAGYPALLKGSAWVQGYLLEFHDPDSAILYAIDKLEDYSPARSEAENEYQRVAVAVYAKDFTPLGTAWTYLMSQERAATMGAVNLPEGNWDHLNAPEIAHPPLLERIR